MTRNEALLDIALVALCFFAVWTAVSLLEIATGGAVAVIAGVIAATWRLRARGDSWRDVGVRKPEKPMRLPLDVIALYALTIAGNAIIVQLLANWFGWPGLGLEAYASLRGDLVAFLTILAIAWTTAAFGEELLFRGFLLTRLQLALPEKHGGTVLAIAFQAFLFGIAHAYLGPRGVATAMLVGVIYATWYVRRGRNLWPLFIAHGLTDTVSLTAIYSGLLPT